MTKEYTKEQLWKLYEKLPDELKEAVFSGETADTIWDICDRNGVGEVSEVAKYTGYVLTGVLSLEEFQTVLEKELKLEKDTAKKVAQEINRFIFYPVKPALEQLFKIEITSSAVPTEKSKPEEEKSPTPSGKDTYREPVE